MHSSHTAQYYNSKQIECKPQYRIYNAMALDYCQARQLRAGFAEESLNTARKYTYKQGTFYMFLGGLFVGVYVCVCEIRNGSSECTCAE